MCVLYSLFHEQSPPGGFPVLLQLRKVCGNLRKVRNDTLHHLPHLAGIAIPRPYLQNHGRGYPLRIFLLALPAHHCREQVPVKPLLSYHHSASVRSLVMIRKNAASPSDQERPVPCSLMQVCVAALPHEAGILPRPSMSLEGIFRIYSAFIHQFLPFV